MHRIEAEKAEMDTLYCLEAKTWMVKGEESMIHWIFEFKDLAGNYWMVEEAAIAKWRDGKIYEDKYIYNMPVGFRNLAWRSLFIERKDSVKVRQTLTSCENQK